jgi:pimeloyl-ACP methyl ester carboxylesterase
MHGHPARGDTEPRGQPVVGRRLSREPARDHPPARTLTLRTLTLSGSLAERSRLTTLALAWVADATTPYGGGVDQLEIEGLRIAYERAGEGPPLVLLHGFVGDSREWRQQLDGLSDEFTVVAWDAPGSGRSSEPPPTFRMPDYADCLSGFVDELGLGRPHVVGLSFGGALALQLYGRHPAIPRTLVLAGAYAGWAGSLPKDIAEERLRLSLQSADLPPGRFVASMIRSMFSGTTPAKIVDGFATIMAEFHPEGFRTMVRSLAEADLRDVLPRVDVATLLLCGDQDLRAPLSVGEDLHAAIGTSTLVVLPGVGHMSNVEAGERFNAEVRTFLRSVQS